MMRRSYRTLAVLVSLALVAMLVPARLGTGVQAQAGATFITAKDNENNALSGTADNDMYSTNAECLFNDNPVTPIEFNIVVPQLPSFSSAQLSLYAYDVDEQGEPGYEPEVDEVYFNGHLVGTLTGWNDVWSSSVFNLDPAWVVQGSNLVEVLVNVRYPNNRDTWCTSIEWGQLVLDHGAGVAFIRNAALDKQCYVPGDQVGVFVEVDTSLASQDLTVEINILDPNGVTRAATTRSFTTRDAEDDSFTESLSLPVGVPTGSYTAQVIVYDTGTKAQQDIWSTHFLVDPSCGTITPVITDTPTPTASPTPTSTATATPTQTSGPPLPPCPVTCDKTVSPASVNAGGEVTVQISLTGSNGTCQVTKTSVDVMLVVDKSGSMSGSKIADAKAAAKVFVDKMDPSKDQVGLASYSTSATLSHELSQNIGDVRASIDGLSASGETNITAGINTAQAELESPRRLATNRPVIVLMTDGKHSGSYAAPEGAANAAKSKGTRIFTIGVGDVDKTRLEALATSPSDYYYAPDSTALATIYEQIAGAIRGQPGTTVRIVDVVAPNMEIVPNSFSGPSAPTVNGQTLTWEVPTLGFETKTWTYKVKVPQTEGMYPVNSSTEITYTDSTGKPAKTNCPSPQVTVTGGVPPLPPLPPCPVICDKSVIPGSVRTGEEMTVLLSLTGKDGTCTRHENADVMLVVDQSGSMRGQKLTDAKAAAKVFVDKMDPSKDQVGLASYSTSATLSHELSRNIGTVRASIDGLSSGGETNITAGINTAQAELESARRVGTNQPVIVLMTDGKHNQGPTPEGAANAAKSKGTRIFTIGVGDVDKTRLEALATSPSDYYYAPDSTALATIYEQIAGAIRGQPGTNIKIVESVAANMSVVPNTFTGSPSPAVSGNTLTWQVASLGFETKTWTLRVRAPQTPGTYEVNQSLEITYIDSTGQLATALCPSPLVTVVPAAEKIPEIYTKDNPGDDGSVPSSEPWWESPDIWIRNQPDGREQHQNPEFGKTNYVHVRVRNIGNVAVDNITVHVHGARAAAAFRWPQDWQPEIGSTTIASLPAGQTATVSVPWQPPLSGHFCFLTRIEAPQDPIRHDGWVKFDNNISQRNVHVMNLKRKPLDSRIIVVNPRLQPKYVSLVIDSTDFPAGGSVAVDFAPDLFQRWREAGGEVTGGEVVPGSSSIAIRPSSELMATIHRLPMTAGEESEITLRVEGPPESRPIVRVREIIDGEEVGGNIYQPPGAALGDGDGDGLCTEVDALMALRMAVGLQPADVARMDIDGDGGITEVDALQILKWAVAGGQCGGA